jgi:hypothetical protein
MMDVQKKMIDDVYQDLRRREDQELMDHYDRGRAAGERLIQLEDIRKAQVLELDDWLRLHEGHYKDVEVIDEDDGEAWQKGYRCKTCQLVFLTRCGLSKGWMDDGRHRFSSAR